MATKDHPGVYVPPPIFYIAFFYFSMLLEYEIALGTAFLRKSSTAFIGWAFIIIGCGIAVVTIIQFIRSRNTLVTIKSAHSLQTTGIYAYSRNPLYVSLFFMYYGFAILYGNWWTFIISPFLVLIMKMYVIKREERYLHRTFGKTYKEYKKEVRRWI
ncbi:MAG TPA: isoprenylcysteine carboxylmethyltransferase family protein [Arachidicoccus sp.]|nr:isoprenylcysteine carboxylmethyltransferase family protein [Arachidicoccus sp.]